MSIDYYWTSHMSAHRDEMLEGLRQLLPWSSLLEVGTHAGPLLRRIREEWPAAELHGCDKDPAYVAWGRGQIPSVEWRVATAPQDLPQYAEKSLDVVVDSAAALQLSVEPERSDIWRHYTRIARVGVAVFWHLDSPFPPEHLLTRIWEQASTSHPGYCVRVYRVV